MACHALLSPSSAHRWLTCPVAPHREALYPDSTSAAAAEGTKAHAMAEACLRIGHDSSYKLSGNADPDMLRHVDAYIKWVRSIAEGSSLFIEKRVVIYPEYGVAGTLDVAAIKPTRQTVGDLKYGHDPVDPETPQLALYGIGANRCFGPLFNGDFDETEVAIFQPRISHQPVVKVYSKADLAAWDRETRPLVKRAFEANKDGKATPSEKACRWCRAKAVCPERRELMKKTATFDFTQVGAKAPEKTGYQEVPLETLAQTYLNLPQLKQYIEDIEAHMLGVARQQKVPGLKWVQGKQVRFIADEVAAVAALKKHHITGFMTDPKMKGIGDLEKLVKEKGVTLESVLGDAMSKRQNDPLLVPESDKRAEFSKEASAKNDFAKPV